MKNYYLLITICVIAMAIGMEAQTQKKGTAKTSGGLRATIANTLTPAHSVALSCAAPTTGTTPTGYFFYRSTTSGGESSSSPLNATQTSTCSYTDTTVLGNTTYYYKATSNCSTCNPSGQSGFSNEATAIIPADTLPNPPTGLATGVVSLYHAPLLWKAPAVQNDFTVANYRVYRGTHPTLPTPTLIATLGASTLSYTDTKCEGTKYYYVKAYDKNVVTGNYQSSGPSNIVTAVCQ